MASEWTIHTLDELYTISSGLSKKREEFGFGFPFLTFKEVFNNPFLPISLPELANTTNRERENCSIKRGDVFLTRTSEKLEELGLSSVALRDYPDATFNGFTKRLRPNEKCVEMLIPEYVAFYLRSNEFRKQVTSFASMTTRASLNNEMISKLTIKVPPLVIQKQIARIMVNLLRKEELNTKTVQSLEQIAQTLFKHWFIDFEFPNEEGLPYKSSTGKLVNSELGRIPEGWNVSNVENFANSNVITGKTPSTKKTEYYDEKGTPFITIPDMHGKVYVIKTNRYLSVEGVESQSKKTLPKNSLCVSCIATPGLVVITSEDSQTNQQINSFTPQYEHLYYLYFYLKGLSDYIRELGSSGSTTLNLNKMQFSKISILKPTEDILRSFTEAIEPLFKQIKNLLMENEVLEEMRVTLIPRLLSGEIEIPDESVVS